MRSLFKKYPLDLMNNYVTFAFFPSGRGINFLISLIITYHSSK